MSSSTESHGHRGHKRRRVKLSRNEILQKVHKLQAELKKIARLKKLAKGNSTRIDPAHDYAKRKPHTDSSSSSSFSSSASSDSLSESSESTSSSPASEISDKENRDERHRTNKDRAQGHQSRSRSRRSTERETERREKKVKLKKSLLPAKFKGETSHRGENKSSRSERKSKQGRVRENHEEKTMEASQENSEAQKDKGTSSKGQQEVHSANDCFKVKQCEIAKASSATDVTAKTNSECFNLEQTQIVHSCKDSINRKGIEHEIVSSAKDSYEDKQSEVGKASSSKDKTAKEKYGICFDLEQTRIGCGAKDDNDSFKVKPLEMSKASNSEYNIAEGKSKSFDPEQTKIGHSGKDDKDRMEIVVDNCFKVKQSEVVKVASSEDKTAQEKSDNCSGLERMRVIRSDQDNNDKMEIVVNDCFKVKQSEVAKVANGEDKTAKEKSDDRFDLEQMQVVRSDQHDNDRIEIVVNDCFKANYREMEKASGSKVKTVTENLQSFEVEQTEINCGDTDGSNSFKINQSEMLKASSSQDEAAKDKSESCFDLEHTQMDCISQDDNDMMEIVFEVVSNITQIVDGFFKVKQSEMNTTSCNKDETAKENSESFEHEQTQMDYIDNDDNHSFKVKQSENCEASVSKDETTKEKFESGFDLEQTQIDSRDREDNDSLQSKQSEVSEASSAKGGTTKEKPKSCLGLEQPQIDSSSRDDNDSFKVKRFEINEAFSAKDATTKEKCENRFVLEQTQIESSDIDENDSLKIEQSEISEASRAKGKTIEEKSESRFVLVQTQIDSRDKDNHDGLQSKQSEMSEASSANDETTKANAESCDFEQTQMHSSDKDDIDRPDIVAKRKDIQHDEEKSQLELTYDENNQQDSLDKSVENEMDKKKQVLILEKDQEIDLEDKAHAQLNTLEKSPNEKEISLVKECKRMKQKAWLSYEETDDDDLEESLQDIFGNDADKISFLEEDDEDEDDDEKMELVLIPFKDNKEEELLEEDEEIDDDERMELIESLCPEDYEKGQLIGENKETDNNEKMELVANACLENNRNKQLVGENEEDDDMKMELVMGSSPEDNKKGQLLEKDDKSEDLDNSKQNDDGVEKLPETEVPIQEEDPQTPRVYRRLILVAKPCGRIEIWNVEDWKQECARKKVPVIINVENRRIIQKINTVQNKKAVQKRKEEIKKERKVVQVQTEITNDSDVEERKDSLISVPEEETKQNKADSSIVAVIIEENRKQEIPEVDLTQNDSPETRDPSIFLLRMIEKSPKQTIPEVDLSENCPVDTPGINGENQKQKILEVDLTENSIMETNDPSLFTVEEEMKHNKTGSLIDESIKEKVAEIIDDSFPDENFEDSSDELIEEESSEKLVKEFEEKRSDEIKKKIDGTVPDSSLNTPDEILEQNVANIGPDCPFKIQQQDMEIVSESVAGEQRKEDNSPIKNCSSIPKVVVILEENRSSENPDQGKSRVNFKNVWRVH